MTNFDDKNNNSNVNKHLNPTLNHRTVDGDVKNGKLKHEIVDQHSTDSTNKPDPNFRPKLRWPDLCAQIFLHAGAIYGLVFQFYTIRFYTLIWCEYINGWTISVSMYWLVHLHLLLFCLQSLHSLSAAALASPPVHIVYSRTNRTKRMRSCDCFWYFCSPFRGSVMHIRGRTITGFITNTRYAKLFIHSFVENHSIQIKTIIFRFHRKPMLIHMMLDEVSGSHTSVGSFWRRIQKWWPNGKSSIWAISKMIRLSCGKSD